MAARSKLTRLALTPASEADFAALYQVELPRIYNFFRYRFGDDRLAEDLTSATFEKAWRNRQRYRRDLSAFSTWLFNIARRVGTDHYRKTGHEISVEELDHLPSADSTEDLAQQSADFARLSFLLARLADRDRELVALKYGAGLTNRTIAALTGLTESNVGVILYRLVNQLREQWEQEP